MKYNIDLNDNDYIEFNYSYLKHSKIGKYSLLVTRISDNNQGWLYACNKKLKRALIKPNTKYTVIANIEKNTVLSPSLRPSRNTCSIIPTRIIGANTRVCGLISAPITKEK